MTTDARLALSQRQRRFEWQLARDEQRRAAARLVAGKTHDLLNVIQIVQLAAIHLERHCTPEGLELIEDLKRAAGEAHRSLAEMMEAARPEEVIQRGAPVGAVVAAALAVLRTAITIDIQVETPSDTATRCSAAELEHILLGLALDIAGAPHVELVVRERVIDGRPWVEIVRSSEYVPADDRFELRTVELIAARAGGELATSERRGGGEDLVVALPVA